MRRCAITMAAKSRKGRDTSWAPSNRTLDAAAEARSSTDPYWDEALTARGHVLLGCGSSRSRQRQPCQNALGTSIIEALM
jgi:hypothetical protein